MIVFDIETKPRTDLVRRFIKPYPAFDPSTVKYGNTKDPAKRADLLAAKQAEHIDGEAGYWKNAEERASLNPLTAEVVVIGLIIDGQVVVLEGTEREILTAFWGHFTDFSVSGEHFVFWSGNGKPEENFDVDMIVRRSWSLGVQVPATVFNGRYLGSRFVDAASRYLLGKREAYCGLSDCADQLGLFAPDCGYFPKSDTDPVQGVNFWQWYEGTMPAADGAAEGYSPETQRAFALKYLRNDLLTLQAIASRIL